MDDLLLTVFTKFEQNGIEYCLLRDGDQLNRLAELGEIDLLLHASQLEHVHGLLQELGFASLPNWGHRPHHFFLSYIEGSDIWLKLDVVTEIAYGRPSRVLRTSLAEVCLRRRQRYGHTFILAAEDELVTLLLHCVLDKGRFSESRRQRLQVLRHEVADLDHLTCLLTSYWSPAGNWADLSAKIDANEWDELLVEGKTIISHFNEGRRLRALSHQTRDRLLRKLNRWSGLWHLPVPMVALLAPDGAGKSTLAEGVKSSFFFPVSSIYMGLYQRNEKDSRQARIPVVGLMRRILIQWGRYLSARYHQAQGHLVVFDRYTYDILASSRKALGRLGRLRRWLLAHACPSPDLAIVLDAPGQLLYERKNEHTPAILESQRRGYLELRSQVPHLVVVDATQSPDHVRREVTALIWRSYTQRLALEARQ